MRAQFAIDSIPADVADALREQSGGLRAILESASREQLLELALQLHEDAESWRWIAGRRQEALQQAQQIERQSRRKGANATNARHEETQAAKRIAFDHWKAWRVSPQAHASRARTQAAFLRWLTGLPELACVEDPKTFGKWCLEWRLRAEEHAAFVSAIERGELPPR